MNESKTTNELMVLWKDWEKSLHDIRNTSIVGIDLAIPIWELVDYSRDPKMKDRIAAIQNYITGGGYEADMSKKFTVGKIGKITDIAIVGNSSNSATHGYPVRFVEK